MPAIDISSIKTILINKPGALGDYIAGSVAVKLLREHFPDAHIALIATPYVRNVMPEGTLIDELINYDEHKKNGKWKFIKYLRSRKFDLAVNLRWTSEGDLLFMALCGAKYRLGLSNLWLSVLYTHRTYCKINQTHEFVKTICVIAPLGINRDASPYIYLPPQAIEFANETFDKFKLSSNKVLLVSPFASNVYKSWPEDYFLETCKIVSNTLPDVKIVVSYGPADADKAKHFVEKVGNNALLCPPTSVAQIAAVIKKSTRVLCNNSGIMNLAMAVGTPTTVVSCTLNKLWGSTGINDVNFEPEGLEKLLEKGKADEFTTLSYLKTITPRTVADSLINILK